MSPSRRPGFRRPRPARTSRYPVSSAPARHDALDWTRAVFAGLEGVLLSWVFVLVPALIAYVVTAAAPSLGDASWQTAVRTATAAWLVGAGGTIETTAVGIAGGDETPAVVSLVPLGLSLLTVVTLAWTTRRQGIRDLPTAAVTAATVVVTHLALSFLAPVSAGRLRLILGSLLIAALGLLLSRPRAVVRRRWPALPRDGFALAGRALVPLGAFGLALVAVAAVLGRDEVARLHGAIAHDAVSSVLLVVAQLAFLPDLVTWALAFAAGPGFVVGEGTRFTSTEVVSAPLPAVPFLGGLPHPGAHALAWLAVVLVLIGAAAGAWAASRRPRERRRDALALAGVAALVVAVVSLVAGAASSGSLGPGRMAHVGVDPWLTAAAIGLEVGAGMAVALLLLHPRTRASLRRVFSRGAPPVAAGGAGAGGSGAPGEPGAPAAGGGDAAARPDDGPDAGPDAGPDTARGADGTAREATPGDPRDEEAVLAAAPPAEAGRVIDDGDQDRGPARDPDRGDDDGVDRGERDAEPPLRTGADEPSDGPAVDEPGAGEPAADEPADDEPAVLVGYDEDVAEVRLDPYDEWAQYRAGGVDDAPARAGAVPGAPAGAADAAPARALGVAERAAARAPQQDHATDPATDDESDPATDGEGAPGPEGPGDDPASALPGERIEPAPRTGLAARLGRLRRR